MINFCFLYLYSTEDDCLIEKLLLIFPLPVGFNKTISQRTVFITQNRRLVINNKPIIIQDIIFSRAMILISTGELENMSIFSSALATYPPSLFFEDGEPRCCKTKSELKKDLQETVSRRSPNPDKLIIDACALLWTIC